MSIHGLHARGCTGWPRIFYILINLFAPGSYTNAESYELNYPENKVIEAAEKVRKDNIYLHIGKGWEDKDSTDYWHYIYFDSRSTD